MGRGSSVMTWIMLNLVDVYVARLVEIVDDKFQPIRGCLDGEQSPVVQS